jgi:hypothetical protein
VLRDRLLPEQRRLDELSFGGFSVRQALERAVHALSTVDPYAAGILPDLAVLADPFDRCTAQQLVGGAEHLVEDALESLVTFRLLEAPAVGRYRLPGLVRLYAASCADADAGSVPPVSTLGPLSIGAGGTG